MDQFRQLVISVRVKYTKGLATHYFVGFGGLVWRLRQAGPIGATLKSYIKLAYVVSRFAQSPNQMAAGKWHVTNRASGTHLG